MPYNSGGYADVPEDEREAREGMLELELEFYRVQTESVRRYFEEKRRMRKRVKMLPEMADLVSQRLVRQGLSEAEVRHAFALWDQNLTPITDTDTAAFQVFAIVQDQVDRGA